MTKKSFKDDLNPAMNFISQESKKKVEKTSSEKIQKSTELRKQAPEGFKVNPLYIEKRSKRIQVLLQPSIYEKIKNKATAEGVSVNEIINNIFIDYFGEE